VRGWVFVSLLEVQAPRLPELAEVKDKVRADLLEQKARDLAKAKAGELRARAQAEGLEKAAAALGLLRKETPQPVGRGEAVGDLGASQRLEEAAFTLPLQALSDPLPTAAGYAVLRVLERTPFDAAAFAQQRDSLLSSLAQQQKEQLFQAYINRARDRFQVERYPAALRRFAG
jgi:parvulin-like peptidyl-prolyl isomerase